MDISDKKALISCPVILRWNEINAYEATISRCFFFLVSNMQFTLNCGPLFNFFHVKAKSNKEEKNKIPFLELFLNKY